MNIDAKVLNKILANLHELYKKGNPSQDGLIDLILKIQSV